MQRKAQLRQEKRLSHLQDLQQPLTADEPTQTCSPLYLCGVFVYICSSPFDMISYAMLPQLVCSIIGCFRLVLLTFLARFVLMERLGIEVAIGVVICSAGTCLCLWFGPQEHEAHSQLDAQLWHQILCYLALGFTVLGVLLVLEHKQVRCCRMGESTSCCTLPFVTALAFALEKVLNTEIGFVTLRSRVWCSMVVGIAGLGLLDFYLNLRGLRRLEIGVFVPLVFGFTTMLQLFQSVVVLNEMEHVSVFRKAVSLCGACMSLLGALLIQSRRHTSAEKMPESTDESNSRPRVASDLQLGTPRFREIELCPGIPQDLFARISRTIACFWNTALPFWLDLPVHHDHTHV